MTWVEDRVAVRLEVRGLLSPGAIVNSRENQPQRKITSGLSSGQPAFTGGTPLSTVIYEPVTDWITGMGIAASDTLSVN